MHKPSNNNKPQQTCALAQHRRKIGNWDVAAVACLGIALAFTNMLSGVLHQSLTMIREVLYLNRRSALFKRLKQACIPAKTVHLELTEYKTLLELECAKKLIVGVCRLCRKFCLLCCTTMKLGRISGIFTPRMQSFSRGPHAKHLRLR